MNRKGLIKELRCQHMSYYDDVDLCAKDDEGYVDIILCVMDNTWSLLVDNICVSSGHPARLNALENYIKRRYPNA